MINATRRRLLNDRPGDTVGAPADVADAGKSRMLLQQRPHLLTVGQLRRPLSRVPLTRVVVAGGDTSSQAVSALDVWALGYLGQVAAGVALCRARSDDPALDGVELMLKGGQMGRLDVFEWLVGNPDTAVNS